MKAFENPHKPKLSLSHFKKADSTSSVAAPVVAISTPTPAQVVVSPVFSAPEPVVMVDVPVVSMIQEVASVVDVAVELPEVVEPSTPIEAKFEPTPVTVETPAAATGSEFFPNLEFENDNLFDDIVKMGTFENEKSEISLLPVEVTLEPVVIEMSEIVATPESTEVPEVSVTTVVPVGELAELVVLEEIPSATVTE